MEGVLRGEDERWEAELEEVREGEGEVPGWEVGWVREDVKRGYEIATQELGRLVGVNVNGDEAAQVAGKGGSLTETVGRVQRARAVAMEFD